ncbi:hypothetical protein ACA910_014770 [Epithemia clementina (nom. ined.)]
MMWSRSINAFLVSFCVAAHLGFEKSSPVAAAANARRRVMEKKGMDDPLRGPSAAPSVSSMPSAGDGFEEQEASTPSPSVSSMPSAGDDFEEQEASTPSPSVSNMPSAGDDFEEQEASTPSPSVSGMPSL